MSDDISAGQPEGPYGIMLPCEPEDFGEFVSGLLGKPQTIRKNQDTQDFAARIGVAANDSAAEWAEMVLRKGVIWRSGQQKVRRRADRPASRQAERPDRPVYSWLAVRTTRELDVPGAS